MPTETLGTDPGEGIDGMGTTIEGAQTGPIGMIQKITINGVEVDMIQVTTMNSPDRFRQFIRGLRDPKDMQIDVLYERENMAVLLGAVGNDNEAWTVTFPDGSTYVQDGFIKKLGVAIPFDDKISQPVSIQFSGPPVFNASSGG